jgi:hypothetical protein
LHVRENPDRRAFPKHLSLSGGSDLDRRVAELLGRALMGDRVEWQDDDKRLINIALAWK